MTARDVQKILGARVLVGEEFLDREITSACASDMMSDVLAFSKDHSVLTQDFAIRKSSGQQRCWILFVSSLSGESIRMK